MARHLKPAAAGTQTRDAPLQHPRCCRVMQFRQSTAGRTIRDMRVPRKNFRSMWALVEEFGCIERGHGSADHPRDSWNTVKEKKQKKKTLSPKYSSISDLHNKETQKHKLCALKTDRQEVGSVAPLTFLVSARKLPLPRNLCTTHGCFMI